MSATELFRQAFEAVPWVAVIFAVGFYCKLKKR